MRRRREAARDADAEPGRDRWLLSYADFITLLLAFFVVLYAVSSVDAARFAAVSGELNAAFHSGPGGALPVVLGRGGAPGSPRRGRLAPAVGDADREDLERLRERLEARLAELARGAREPERPPDLVQDEGSLVVSLPAAAAGSDEEGDPEGEARRLLREIGAVLATSDLPVRVEVRGGDGGSAWTDTALRAARVVERLQRESKLEASRLAAVGLGPGGDAAHRVDLRVLTSAAPGAGDAPRPRQLQRLLERLPPPAPPSDAGTPSEGG